MLVGISMKAENVHFSMNERDGASWKGTSYFVVGESVHLSWRNCKVRTAGPMAAADLLPRQVGATVDNQIVLNAHCQVRTPYQHSESAIVQREQARALVHGRTHLHPLCATMAPLLFASPVALHR